MNLKKTSFILCFLTAAIFLSSRALDAQLRSLFASTPAGPGGNGRGFLVFHPAWGYFAKDYGLTQQAIEFEGKEPSPRRLAATFFTYSLEQKVEP